MFQKASKLKLVNVRLEWLGFCCWHRFGTVPTIRFHENWNHSIQYFKNHSIQYFTCVCHAPTAEKLCIAEKCMQKLSSALLVQHYAGTVSNAVQHKVTVRKAT
jgi:hypothetical protein